MDNRKEDIDSEKSQCKNRANDFYESEDFKNQSNILFCKIVISVSSHQTQISFHNKWL